MLSVLPLYHFSLCIILYSITYYALITLNLVTTKFVNNVINIKGISIIKKMSDVAEYYNLASEALFTMDAILPPLYLRGGHAN